jgi:hypothetical protein
MNKLYFLVFSLLISLYLPQTTSASEITSGTSASLQQSTFIAKGEDNRGKILKKFLEKHSSPLVAHSYVFIKHADKYNLDWRLVASISGVESTFGKFIPYNSYNGWGWGVYGENVIYFSSWEEGIETISRGLRENYIDKWGAEDVYAIGSIYAASPRWAGNVAYFMEKITQFQYENQIETLSISI